MAEPQPPPPPQSPGCKPKEARPGGPADRLTLNRVLKIMKEAMGPGDYRVSQEARECMQACAGEFVQFVASEADDLSKGGYIDGTAVLSAMERLGFNQQYIAVLAALLRNYRAECAVRLTQRQFASDAEDEAEGADANAFEGALPPAPSGPPSTEAAQMQPPPVVRRRFLNDGDP